MKPSSVFSAPTFPLSEHGGAVVDSMSLPFVPVIVTGAPRSGTHFIHSLICTSSRTNPFVPESHYLYFLLEAYLRSLKVVNSADSAGFGDPESFASHHFAMIRSTLMTTWKHLGKPELLVLKHCSFTPVLPVLARRFGTMRFVVIRRDARDAIASELRAAERATKVPLGNTERTTVVERSIDRYNLYYGALAAAAAELAERLYCVQYEELVNGTGIDGLASFLDIPDLAPDQLWKRARFDISDYRGFPLYSELWGAPMSPKNVGRYLETLSPCEAGVIADRTRLATQAYDAVQHSGSR